MPGWIRTLFDVLLRCYPAAFRDEYEGSIRADVERLWRERQSGGSPALGRLSLGVAVNTVKTAAREHLHILRQDLKTARRSLGAAPAFTIGTVLTLALGIGVTTAMFSIVRAVLLEPLPFADPDGIVEIVATKPLEGITAYDLSIPDFRSFEDRARSFAAVAVLDDGSRVLTGDGHEAIHVVQMAVSPAFWSIVGITPLVGRTFDQSDLDAGGRVALISAGLFQRRYGGDRRAIGRTITVSGALNTIIGVVPSDMGFTQDTDVWLAWRPNANPSRGDRQINAIGRLKAGVTADQASAELAGIAASLAGDFPVTNAGYSARARPLLDRVVSTTVERALTVLLTTAALLLVVACANVANLLLTRATARTPELALRRALGAGHSRLVRQLATESFLLATLGVAVGVVSGALAIKLVRSTLLVALPRASDVTIDGQTLAVAGLLTFFIATICALVPVWRTVGRDAACDDLRANRASTDRSHRRMRRAFVAAQVCLATVLVTGAVLLTTTLFRLLQVEPGFHPERLLVARVSLPTTSYSGRESRNAFYHRLADALAAEPGVEAAAFINRAPLTPDGGTRMEIGASPPVNGTLDGQPAHFRVITSSYFSTIGLSVTRGHVFDSRRPETPNGLRPLIISESLARRLWPNGDDPISRPVWLGNGQTRSVVGVVGDVHQGRLGEGVTPTMYMPTSWTVVGTMTLVVKGSQGDPSSLAPLVRRVVTRLDRDLPIFEVETMESQRADTMLPNRLNAGILVMFAALALALGIVGVAGVIADTVTLRRPELAIKMALGASASRVVRDVAAEGIRLCSYGLAAGVVGAWMLGRAMSGLLFGVRGHDPAIVAASAAALMIVGIAACLVPAARAMRVDPAVALRGE
jgi:putative ABC transport system permease protein